VRDVISASGAQRENERTLALDKRAARLVTWQRFDLALVYRKERRDYWKQGSFN